MLNASFGSEVLASRASPDMRTQPRLMPPAAGVWIAYSCFLGRGEAKKDFDLGVLVGSAEEAVCNINSVAYLDVRG